MYTMLDAALHEYKEKPGSCAECGNSPVNHFEHYVSNTLAVWTAESSYKGKGMFARAVRYADAAFDNIEQVLLKSLGAMPFASYSARVEGAATYRSQVVWEEAVRRGIQMQQLCLFGKLTEIYRASLETGWFYFQSLPIPLAKRGTNVAWLDDKYLLKQFFASRGIPSPQSISVRSEKEAVQAFETIGRDIVVKPRSGSRGRHTTVLVQNSADVVAAYRVARQLCAYVVIETYLPGPVCRATLVDGVLAGFFLANPPIITGDGVSTVSELIEKKNVHRESRVGPVILNAEHRVFLEKHGLYEESVPHAGREIALTHRTGRLFGGTTRELLHEVHPKLRAALEKAAATVGAGVIGFDLIMQDPEKDPDAQEWGIIEANTLPYIDLHYLPLIGTPSNVAAHVWDLWSVSIHTQSVHSGTEKGTIHA